jgi:hypothetical protein
LMQVLSSSPKHKHMSSRHNLNTTAR